jgi:FkbM family methyltransferase
MSAAAGTVERARWYDLRANCMLPAWMKRSAAKRAEFLEARLDALLADHTSLLQVAARSLELLHELDGVTRQWEAQRLESNAVNLRELAIVRDRLERLSTESKMEMRRFEAANIEELACVTSRMELIGSEWDLKFAGLESRIDEERQFGAERLKRLAAEIRTNPADFGLLNPEAGLMAHLYSYLPVTVAIDVGSNKGAIAERLLDAGYEVYAFEPFLPVFEELQSGLGSRARFKARDIAIGSTDTVMKLHIAQDLSPEGKYKDPGQLSSLIPHSMPSDLPFTTAVEVSVRSLKSLAADAMIPRDVGLLKIDTEGYDLEVIRGMDDLRPHVLVSEYWAADFVFGQSGTLNRLDELVKEARERGYRWFIVLYRHAGSERVSFYCNYDKSVSNSWGNVFFFQDRELFLHAMEWCSAVLPATYFNSVATTSHDYVAPLQNLRLSTSQSLNNGNASDLSHSAHNESAGNAAISAIGTRLDQLGRLISIRGEEIAQFHDAEMAHERSLISLTSVVSRLERELTRPKAEAEPRTHSADGDSLQMQVDELKRALAEKSDAIEGLKQGVKRIKRSFSWKLTSPLREIRRVGARIGRYARGS